MKDFRDALEEKEDGYLWPRDVVLVSKDKPEPDLALTRPARFEEKKKKK